MSNLEGPTEIQDRIQIQVNSSATICSVRKYLLYTINTPYSNSFPAVKNPFTWLFF